MGYAQLVEAVEKRDCRLGVRRGALPLKGKPGAKRPPLPGPLLQRRRGRRRAFVGNLALHSRALLRVFSLSSSGGEGRGEEAVPLYPEQWGRSEGGIFWGHD